MTKVKMAKQFLSICPTCNGNIGFGHLYVTRSPAPGISLHFHTQCDPQRPPSQCWCGGEIGETETEHQTCFDRRLAIFRFTQEMAGIFSPKPVAKFPRMRA